MFSNTCGCGCEQNSECLDMMDCTPTGGACDEDLGARFPYANVTTGSRQATLARLEGAQASGIP